jgi:hypothetical protein
MGSFSNLKLAGRVATPDDAIDAFVGAAGPDAGSPLLLAQFHQAGGALGRPAENSGALDKLDADFVMLGIGMSMGPEAAAAVDESLDRLNEAMEPWAAEGGYFNFAERPCEVSRASPRRPASASPR